MKTNKRPAVSVGYRVGKLTVEAPTPERKNGYIVWNCVCDCGGAIRLDTCALQRGAIRDCGCETRVRPGRHDLTGRRFGGLTCLAPVDGHDQNGQTSWRCRCDCGSECLAMTAKLLAGSKKSCGCIGRVQLKKYVGRRFGMLTVTGYAGKRNGMHRWNCVCDCGNETTVGQTLLQNGKTRSCGCLQAAVFKENLKLCEGTSVTFLEAGKRRRLRTNTSGCTGVYCDKRTGHWIAQITFKHKTYYLGSYRTLEEAAAARQNGEKMHDDFLEWYYQQHHPSCAKEETA